MDLYERPKGYSSDLDGNISDFSNVDEREITEAIGHNSDSEDSIL